MDGEILRNRADGEVRPEGEAETSRQSVVLSGDVSALGWTEDRKLQTPRIGKSSVGSKEASYQCSEFTHTLKSYQISLK